MNILSYRTPAALGKLQQQATKGIAFALWAHLPIILGLGLWIASDRIVPSLAISAISASVATFSVLTSPSTSATRCLVASSYSIQAAALVFLCSGHAWQIDMHMYFFAALAISVATFDAKAVLATAAVTALHHLTLNVIAPAWVFPGGADFARVIIHAVIVVVQTAVLLTLIYKLHSAVATADEKSKEVVKAQEVLEQEDLRRQEMVQHLAGALASLASGNLTTRLSTEFGGSYKKLQIDFNKSLHSLELMICEVVEQIVNIRGGAEEINQAAFTLSSRTENQAASLADTAAALDEITVTVDSTAKGSTEASKLVTATQTRAQESGEVVKSAMQAMGEIESSSNQIADVVSVIDEIAFQTNLLALNAGVEAARAGNAGKGFAVVATEVRQLAQRSSEAAQKIKTMISTSKELVENGVTLVGRAGNELEEIADKVTKFAELVHSINLSTQEQATALSEVNSTVSQMNQMTQHNAAMAEETTAASHSLSSSAERLTHIVQRFKTNVNGHQTDQNRQNTKAVA